MEKQTATVFEKFSPQERTVLAIAAFFIKEFSVDWIIELSGERPSHVILSLNKGVQLAALQQITPTSYLFRNDALQKKFIQMLDADKISSIRQQIANIVLSEACSQNINYEEAVHYLFTVNNKLEGCDILFRSGIQYIKDSKTDEAIKCFDKALEDLKNLDGDDANSLLFKTAIEYGKISFGFHEAEYVISILLNARDKAIELSNKPYQALLDMSLARIEWMLAHHDIAIEYFKKGWNIVQEMDDPHLMKSAINFSVFFLTWQGRFQEAVQTYEKARDDIESYAEGGFPLLALISIGCSYVNIGQVTQGMGVLDAILSRSTEKGKTNISITALWNLSASMLVLGRSNDALRYISAIKKEALIDEPEFHFIINLLTAYANFLDKEYGKMRKNLLQYLKISTQFKTADFYFGYTMAFCWAMEQGIFPYVKGITLENEIDRCLKTENIFIKGVACKYQALLLQKQNLPFQRVIKSFQNALIHLEKSGHVIEIARTRIEFANYYSTLNEPQKAKKQRLSANKILSDIDPVFIPDDLKNQVEKPMLGPKIFKDILKLTQKTVTLQDKKELILQIISTVNRITGSERGALFMIEEESETSELKLKAAQNLTPEDVSQDDFKKAKKMMASAMLTGEVQFQIAEEKTIKKGLHKMPIRSRICAPLKIKNKITGILYHDNRLFGSSFNEDVLEILSYFAAQAAAAIEQSMAYEEISRLNQKLKEEKQYFEDQFHENLHFEEIIGQSIKIKSVLNQVMKVANKDTTVLILGETGVGKELIAKAVHKYSPRNDKPFIRVHCASLPESLISSELFGHEKGSFTGASERRIGRFELANGGTLFLDEIGDIPMDVQIRLLRVLQTGEFERVGARTTLHSDFRLLTATNRNLGQLVKEGTFREDLFYRLNVFPVHIPPLRERKEDIPLLVLYFLNRHAQKLGKEGYKISTEEMKTLTAYEWPGNVRELENVIERGTILTSGPDFVTPELGIKHLEMVEESFLTLSKNEQKHITSAIKKSGGKIKGPNGAAELLGIPSSTLRSKMKKLGINRY